MSMKSFGVFLFWFSLLIFVGTIIDVSYVGYQYEKNIGAYIENAYEVNTPDEMINQVKKAMQRMRDAGLDEDDYGALIFKKPNNKMEWQYKFLNNFIERAEAVKVWYEATYGGDVSATESLGDVYETKMDNLREFLKENGRADWISQDAWWIKYHIFLYIFWFPLLIIGFIMLLVSIGMIIEG